MTVGMNEIAGTNRHSGDANLAAKTVGVNVGVRGSDGAGERLEARRPLRGIADGSVSDNAQTAQRLVHRALHLAPEGSEPNLGAVDILDHVDTWTWSSADIFIIGDPQFLLFGG